MDKLDMKLLYKGAFFILLFIFCPLSWGKNKDKIQNDIIGLWHFDEGKGSIAKDSSGSGNDLMLDEVGWTEGKKGKCISFDGKKSRAFIEKLVLKHALLNNEFTISCWLKPEYEYKTMRILSSSDYRLEFRAEFLAFCSRFNNWELQTPSFKDDGKIQEKVIMKGASAAGLIRKGIIANRWYHIAITYKDNLYTIYIDGRIACESKGAAVLPLKERLVIGDNIASNPNCYYKGLFDELEILQRAKTGKEIIEDALSCK